MRPTANVAQFNPARLHVVTQRQVDAELHACVVANAKRTTSEKVSLDAVSFLATAKENHVSMNNRHQLKRLAFY